MALEIVWTKRAEIGYAKIIDYIETNFTEKEVRKFVRQSNEFFALLSEYPEMLESTGKKKYVHRGPINIHAIDLPDQAKKKADRIDQHQIIQAKAIAQIRPHHRHSASAFASLCKTSTLPPDQLLRKLP